MPERATRSPTCACSAIQGWRKKVATSTPVSSITESSTICMRGRGRLSSTRSTVATIVASVPTSARAILVTRVKSR